MSEAGRPEVTLHTLHQDLGEVRSDLREVKTDIREVKALLTTRLPAPDWPGEMLRTLRENTQFSRENTQLLRENNRISEERFTRLDVTLREQAIETHTVLRTVAEGQRQLSADTRALIARIDALIRGRGDGSPAW
jgi:uncharacterized protein (DUF3084 family)